MMTLAESACTLRLRGKLLPGEDAMPAVEPMQSAVLRFRKVSLLEPSFDWLSCNHAALMDRACDDGFFAMPPARLALEAGDGVVEDAGRHGRERTIESPSACACQLGQCQSPLQANNTRVRGGVNIRLTSRRSPVRVMMYRLYGHAGKPGRD